MGFVERLKHKFGFGGAHSGRHPIRIFLLEDDARRCEWFAKGFKGEHLYIVDDVVQEKELLQKSSYDAIFLDDDLMPEHYGATEADDERTGYAIASFLAAHPELQRSATIMVHSFNADGAMRMVEQLSGAGRQAEYIPFHFLEEPIKNFCAR